jgi:hypothetical protein
VGNCSTERPRGWVRLSDTDDVVVLTESVEPGDELCGPQDEHWTIDRPLAVGHKLAARPIANGETVLKYGFPIGVATQPIAAGEHVHSHNLRSIRIPFADGEPG